MTDRCLIILTALPLIVALHGCASSQNADRGDAADAADVSEGMDLAKLERMMREKLDHSSRLLGALSLADFTTIEHSSNRLFDISSESSWLIHETVAYSALAETFRDLTLELAAYAREKNLDACEQTYLKLTASCVKCHDYLRREAIERPMPGRITFRFENPTQPTILSRL